MLGRGGIEMLPGILKPIPPSQAMGVLLLASREDPASLNIMNRLVASSNWKNPEEFPHGEVRIHESKDVHIVEIDDLHIWSDGIDDIHENETGMAVSEVLVLSRHVSSSEVPSLTLHAIGVPGESPHGEKGIAGGIKGQVVPPSPRFGSLFREMSRIAKEHGIDDEYDITLEATHHGPSLSRPTLYLEIGSTPDRWADVRAAAVWSEAITLCLGLNGGEPMGEWSGEGEVMVGLGGGHYAPRHRAVISSSDVWIGHILASYALEFENHGDPGRPPTGNWKHSVETSIESTRSAFPGGDVFVHIDRKSFKGWQREALRNMLSEMDIRILRGRDIH